MSRSSSTTLRFVLLSVAVCVAVICGALLLFSSLDTRPVIRLKPAPAYPESIVFAADFDFEPYSFMDEDKKLGGHDIELAYAIGEKLRKNVIIRLVPWAEARKLVLDGEADLLLGLEYKPEALPEFQLSIPLRNDPFVAFGIKPIQRTSGLYGARIAALQNSGSIAAFLQPYRLLANATLYQTYGEAFQSVIRNENDVAIARYSVGRRAIARLQASSLRATGPVLAENHMCLGTRAANAALLEEVNTALLALMEEGTIDTLHEKWLGTYVEVVSFSEFLRQYSLYIIGGLMSLTVLGFGIYVHINARLIRAAEARSDQLARIVEYQQLLNEATKGLYDRIYELNLTHNCPASDSTRQFYAELGIPENTPFDQALRMDAEKTVLPEYLEGYLNTFLPEKALHAYKKHGINNLRYEFRMSTDGLQYVWMRMFARIFDCAFDNSVRMIVYRQNINAEKKHEQNLMERLRRDPMTNIYNKRAVEELIDDFLQRPEPEGARHAFIMLDIDNFKHVNDSLGHAFGDYVITQFVAEFRRHFPETDLMGRLGGDEFVIFLPHVPSLDWMRKEAGQLVASLHRDVQLDGKDCPLSASVGIALSPVSGHTFEALYREADKALYQTKQQGKNGFTIARETEYQGSAE